MNENLENLLTNFTELLSEGLACIAVGDYDQAIEVFTKALELKLHVANANRFYALAYYNRGLAYIKTGNFRDAFKDFVKTNKYDQVVKTERPETYVADKITDIYKVSDKEDGGKAFGQYCKLLEAISRIRQKLFHAPQQNAEIAHYTNLHTLKSLASKERFRLYNAAYMNDPEEGRVFFEIMNSSSDIDIDIEDSFYPNGKLRPSPAYIGSFFKVDKQDKEKDKLFLWRTYGKHDGQEAAGACLIFKHEGTAFAKNCGLQIGDMQQLQAKLSMLKGDHQNPEEKQPRKPDLYKIVYSDENLSTLSDVDAVRLSFRGYSDEETNRGLSEELNKLAETLKQIKGHIEEKDDNSQKELKQLARDLLDTIRFLFKARHYREEKEVRVVQVRYYDEENTPQDDGSIHVDMEQIPPRFYLETHENFRFSEVILGRQARGFLEWKRWLNEHDNTLSVKRSGIKYGKPYL